MQNRILNWLSSFQQKGSFIVTANSNLRQASITVPNEIGFYIIYACDQDGNKYIVRYGKSGMSKKGVFTKVQRLKQRLNNVGKHSIPRQQIFQQYIFDHDLKYLEIQWFATWGEQRKINPCTIESVFYYFFPINANCWLD